MPLTEPKHQFDFVIHRNGFRQNVSIFAESKWLAAAQLRAAYPGASFTPVVGGKK